MPSTTAIKGCYSSCAWRSDPLAPPPPPPPNSQVLKMEIRSPSPRDKKKKKKKKKKIAPPRRYIGGLMPSTTAIKGCYSSCAWRSDPLGHGMPLKCEEPLDELTVQVWLLYDHLNLKYCTLFVSGTELRTDRRTDGRTDGRTDRRTDKRTIQTLDAPGGPFRPGA